MLPPVQWRIRNWLSKEPLLRGQPASYWKQQLKENYLGWRAATERSLKLGYFEAQMERYGIRQAPLEVASAQRVFSGPEAVPILFELLTNSDHITRGQAILFLHLNQHAPETVSVALLAQYRKESDPLNQRNLLVALASRAQFIPDAVPELVQGLVVRYEQDESLGEYIYKLDPAEAARLGIVKRE